jgi:hypothetical protein
MNKSKKDTEAENLQFWLNIFWNVRELSLFNGGRATRMVVKPLEKNDPPLP